jgi:hypothetical protein
VENNRPSFFPSTVSCPVQVKAIAAAYGGEFVMEELVSLIVKFGWPTVLVAALILIVLRGQISFRYPRDSQSKRKNSD